MSIMKHIILESLDEVLKEIGDPRGPARRAADSRERGLVRKVEPDPETLARIRAAKDTGAPGEEEAVRSRKALAQGGSDDHEEIVRAMEQEVYTAGADGLGYTPNDVIERHGGDIFDRELQRRLRAAWSRGAQKYHEEEAQSSARWRWKSAHDRRL